MRLKLRRFHAEIALGSAVNGLHWAQNTIQMQNHRKSIVRKDGMICVSNGYCQQNEAFSLNAGTRNVNMTLKNL